MTTTGVISNWEDSPFDLRRRRLTVAEPTTTSSSPTKPRQRCAICNCWTPTANDSCSASAPTAHGAVLSASDEDLDELIGAVAAEANHESNRRRQQRLDAAFETLNDKAAGRR